MSTVQEIEAAIQKLSRDELLSLVNRLRSRYADVWDQQIEGDAREGRLDALYGRLVKEDPREEVPLDDFLDDQKLP